MRRTRSRTEHTSLLRRVKARQNGVALERNRRRHGRFVAGNIQWSTPHGRPGCSPGGPVTTVPKEPRQRLLRLMIAIETGQRLNDGSRRSHDRDHRDYRHSSSDHAGMGGVENLSLQVTGPPPERPERHRCEGRGWDVANRRGDQLLSSHAAGHTVEGHDSPRDSPFVHISAATSRASTPQSQPRSGSSCPTTGTS